MRRSEIYKERIRNRWAGTGIDDACVNIINYIIDRPKDNSESITLSKFAEIAKVDPKSDIFFSVITVLCSRFPVLKWNFVYFSDSGDIHYLDDNESMNLVETGEYIDQDNGEKVDPSSTIRPYLSADRDHLEEDIS